MKHILLAFVALYGSLALASPPIINGHPAGNLFPAVGWSGDCTITKVGPRQFLTAGHCTPLVCDGLCFSSTAVPDGVTLPVKSTIVHPSWLKDCAHFDCTGTEVGGPNMTPGRADIALVTTSADSPQIPIIPIHFDPLSTGTAVTMVGYGCTHHVEPDGPGRLRYGTSQTVSYQSLIHKNSLYKDIAEITGQSDWVTPGYAADTTAMSLCPGDSGGPLLIQNASGGWELVGIAADYTFNGPYHDGDFSVTNLHTRVDDASLQQVGAWLRQNWGSLAFSSNVMKP